MEFKLEDFWVGAYWKLGELNSDLWICIVPCLPLHVMWRRVRCERCGALVRRVYTDSAGVITACCIECAWNPNGCRCRFGEFGKADDNDWCDALAEKARTNELAKPLS